MYNLSEDLIFSCLDFQSQNSDLQPPNAQAEAAQIPAFHEKPLAHLAEDFSVQKAKVQILDPTSHLFHESFSDPTDLNLQVRGLQVQKGNAPREIRQIFCSPSTIAERIQCLKGQPYQTQNMGKHLRSITASFLATLGQATLQWKFRGFCYTFRGRFDAREVPGLLLLEGLHGLDNDAHEDEFPQPSDHDKIWRKIEKSCIQEDLLLENGGELKITFQEVRNTCFN